MTAEHPLSAALCERTDLSLWQLRAAPDALADVGAPAQLFAWQPRADGPDLVARTGVRECLLLERESSTGQTSQKTLENGAAVCFLRSDRIFQLSGADRFVLLSYLCAHDLSKEASRQFCFVSMAGVSVWVGIGYPDDGALLLGCDPSYGDYLAHTLNDFLAGIQATEICY